MSLGEWIPGIVLQRV